MKKLLVFLLLIVFWLFFCKIIVLNMPITVKDYVWDETESSVHITIPLKGVKSSKADIFSTDDYLKVNYPPYLFEIMLFKPVDDSKGTAQIKDGTIVFNLLKHEPVIWSQLTSPDSGDKELMKSQRQLAIEAAHKKADEEKKEAAIRKREAEKFALQEQMRLDAEERKMIEETKEAERRKATEDIESWKIHGISGKNTETKKKDVSKKDMFKEDEIPPPSSGAAPRQSGSIKVNFTPRVFPTPMRESKKADEDAWLKKQAEARRVADVENSDLSAEEKNPQWLKEKGDGFFKSGNFLAAINAYNLAVRLDSKLPSIYSNRAACHLKLRNFMKCIEDSSKALELLTPPVLANAPARLRSHARRGTAFCEMELYIEGLQDYEAALKIDQNNEKLQEDAEKIRKVIQGT
ncbi:dynein assembly factor 4, axonemal-like [Anneissia japonica]|uniref:dynein assembly factor 4, axonemal-like n=1 Tax=Anneissia japonica TaxID=1529436 RepID=UPI001425A49A|nr:dynein assembly factor 4, axonemal-like [Anneissia japonica]